ncbi:MAG: LysR family transcriptional regulator [Pseudomonadota bacterium]
MDISAIQAFRAVADSGSFSQAAERLYITQPAVSKRIAALERELDRPLFDRIGRQVVLTEAGRALLPHARRILDEVELSRRAMTDLSGRIAGRLSLGTSHHIGLHRLPPLLRELRQRYPELQLDIRFLDSETACRAVEHGELELAIVTLPPRPSAQLQLAPVWQDPLSVVCATDHPLAGYQKAGLPTLAQHRAILPGPETFTRQIVESAFKPLSMALQVELSTNYLETIKMLTAVGLGWSVLPDTMLDSELKRLNTPLHLSRQLGVVQHAARTPSNAARAMLELLMSVDKS